MLGEYLRDFTRMQYVTWPGNLSNRGGGGKWGMEYSGDTKRKW